MNNRDQLSKRFVNSGCGGIRQKDDGGPRKHIIQRAGSAVQDIRPSIGVNLELFANRLGKGSADRQDGGRVYASHAGEAKYNREDRSLGPAGSMDHLACAPHQELISFSGIHDADHAHD